MLFIYGSSPWLPPPAHRARYPGRRDIPASGGKQLCLPNRQLVCDGSSAVDHLRCRHRGHHSARRVGSHRAMEAPPGHCKHLVFFFRVNSSKLIFACSLSARIKTCEPIGSLLFTFLPSTHTHTHTCTQYIICLVIIVILEIVAGILGFVYRGVVVRALGEYMSSVQTKSISDTTAVIMCIKHENFSCG